MSTQGDPASNSSPHRRHRSDETNQIVMAKDPVAFAIGLGDEMPPELPPRNTETGPYRRTRSSGTVSVVSAPVVRQTTPKSSREEDNYFDPADTLRSGRSSTASIVSLQEKNRMIMHNKILSHNPRGISPLEPSGAPPVKDMSEYSIPFNQLEDQQRGRGGSVMSVSSMGSNSSLHQSSTTSKIVSAYMAKRGHPPPLPQGNPLNDTMTAPPAFPPPPPPEAAGGHQPPLSSFSPPPIPVSGVVPPSSDYEDPWDARSNLRNLPIHRTRVNDERRFTAPASHRLPGSRTSPQPDIHHHHRRSDQHRRTSDQQHRSSSHHHEGHHNSSRRDKSHRKSPVEPAHPRTHSGSTSDYVPADPSPAWPPASGEPEYVVPPDAQDHPIRIHTYPPPILHDGGGGIVNGGHYVNQPQLPAAPLSPPLPPRNARTHGYPPLLPDPSITPTDHRPPQWQIDPAIPLEDQL